MSKYEFTTEHPPLLRDLGARSIIKISIFRGAGGIKNYSMPLLKVWDLNFGISGLDPANMTIPYTLTTTKAWVRLGEVTKLSSDEEVTITQSTTNSVEQLDKLRALLAVSMGV